MNSSAQLASTVTTIARRSAQPLPSPAVLRQRLPLPNALAERIAADRDAIPDVDVIGQCLGEALAELVDTTTASRIRAPRGWTPRA